MKLVDLTNKKFGRLLVIKRSNREDPKELKNKNVYWECLCDCGKIKHLQARALKRGGVKSCGCYRAELTRKEPGEANYHSLYCQYRAGARHRNHSFALKEEDFRNLIVQNCFYCDSPPSQKIKAYKQSKNSPEWIKKCEVVYNGIDRIDSSIGYQLDNCLPCCKLCNTMKHTQPFDEFLLRIKTIYKLHEKRINEKKQS